jgi:hypothetical protein
MCGTPSESRVIVARADTGAPMRPDTFGRGRQKNQATDPASTTTASAISKLRYFKTRWWDKSYCSERASPPPLL